MTNKSPRTEVLDINFQEYLQSVDHHEFRLVKAPSEFGQKFYIHPLGKNGNTLDFVVEGAVIVCTTEILSEEDSKNLSPEDVAELSSEKMEALEKASTHDEIESILES